VKALILNNKVVDTSDTEFEVHSSMTWVDCSDTVRVGFEYDGSSFTDPDVDTRTADEIAADNLADLRVKRADLLAATDWWASSDLTMTAEQTAYRQALRDITKTYSSLDDVVWPTKPE